MSLLTLAVAAWAQGVEPGSCPEIAWPTPIDPALARETQQVTVRVAVDPAGVATVRPVAGPGALAQVLVERLPACRWRPAEVDGLPVPGEVEVVWTFEAVPPQVTGVVLRRGDRVPIGGAQVSIGSQTAVTDPTGRFALSALGDGPQTLQVRAPGVVVVPVPLGLAAGEAVDLTVWAFPQSVDDVLVGTYAPDTGPAAQVFRPDDARVLPGTLGDAVRALHASPSLSRTPFDAGWLLVRGGDAADTATFVDGVPTPLLWHLGGFTSIFHPALVGEVRFWPDGAPARYGEALTGAAEVALAATPTTSRAAVGMNVVYTELFAEAPIGDDAGFQAAARRSYLDAVLAAALGGEAAQIAPRFYDGTLRFTGPGWSVTALGVSDIFDAPTGEGDETVTILQGGGQLQGRFTRGDWSFTPWVSTRTQQLQEATDAQRIVEWYPGGRLERRLDSPRGSAQIGIEAQSHTFHLTQGGDVRRAPLLSGAPYASLQWGKPWTLRAGLRYDAAWTPGQPVRHGPAPQVGLTVPLAPSVSWKADWGRWQKRPDAIYLIGLSEGTYLDLERADAASTGFRWARGPLQAGLDGYVRRGRDIAGFEQDGSLGGLTTTTAGLEAQARIDRTDVSVSALYTYVAGRRVEDLGDPPLLSPYDRPHRGEIVGIWRLPRALVLSTRFRVTSGYPRRDEVEAYDILTGELRSLGTDDRLSPYHALDLKIVRPFPFRTWRLDASLDLLNVYNRRVPEPVITGFGDSNPAIGFGLPILPVFGLTGTFWP